MSDSPGCPSQQALRDFFAGKLAGDEAENCASMSKRGADCRRAAGGLMEATPTDTPAPDFSAVDTRAHPAGDATPPRNNLLADSRLFA